MKKPEIIYCNVIRKDKAQGQVAIKVNDIENVIDSLIEAKKSLEFIYNNTIVPEEYPDHLTEPLIMIDKALRKAGCE